MLALDTLGNVYSWGDNKKGQLGLGREIEPEGLLRKKGKKSGNKDQEEEKLEPRDEEYTPEQVIENLKDHEIC